MREKRQCLINLRVVIWWSINSVTKVLRYKRNTSYVKALKQLINIMNCEYIKPIVKWAQIMKKIVLTFCFFLLALSNWGVLIDTDTGCRHHNTKLIWTVQMVIMMIGTMYVIRSIATLYLKKWIVFLVLELVCELT